MLDEERQRMNVWAIRITLESALRYATPDEAQRCRARARELLVRARDVTTSTAVVAEIAALQAELDADSLGHQAGES